MPINYSAQLVVYAPNGSRQGILPDVTSLTATSPFNDVSSLQFSYPKTGRNANLLTDAADGFFEIALEIDAGGGYFEPANSRFINLGREDEGSNDSSEMSFQMPGYGWLLQTGRVGTTLLNKEGKRAFANTRAGFVLASFILEAKDRGALPGLAMNFSSTVTSTNQSWAKIFSTDYDPGTDILTILRALTDDGLCDWKFAGRTLAVNNIDTAVIDRSDTVVLRYGQELADGPNKVDATNLLHRVTVEGEESRRVVRTQVSSSPKPWGSFEGYVDAGGVKDVGSLNQIGDASLTAGSMPGMQLTRTIQLEDTQFAPHSHYNVGDWISAPGLNGAIEKLRVREIAISKSAGGLQAALVLNDRLTENSVKQTRKTNAMRRGSGTPRGAGTAPSREDKRPPAAPVGLSLGVDYFMDNAGDDHGIAILGWQAVTEAFVGGEQAISSYNVWQYSPAGTGGKWQRVGGTQHPDTEITLSPYQVGTTWQFAVSAIGDNGIEGPRSTAVSGTFVADSVPPPIPSTPQLSARLGVLLITWDGLGVGNVPMPKDFNVTEVHVSATNNFTPSSSTLVDLLAGKGMVPITNLPYNATRYVKFVAVDRRLNRSAASAQAAGVVTPLVDTDMINAVISGANLIDYSIDGTQKIAAGTIDTTRLRVGQANLLVDSNFMDAGMNTRRLETLPVAARAGVVFHPATTTSRGYVSFVGNYPSDKFLFLTPDGSKHCPIDVTPGQEYVFTCNYQGGASVSTSHLYLFWVDANGTRTAGSGSGVGYIAIPPGSATGVYTAVWTAPLTAVAVGIALVSTPGNAGTVAFYTPTFRPRIPGVLIEDGAVTAAKVAALAIEAGKIAANAITADKIVAGAITGIKISGDAIDGKTITGATIRTAASGARVQIDSGGVKQVNSSNLTVSNWSASGFLFRTALSGARSEFDLSGMRLYNSAGVNTVNLSTASGEGMVSGIFRSAPSNVYPRIEINDSLYNGSFSGIRFYGRASGTNPEIWAIGGSGYNGWPAGSMAMIAGNALDTNTRAAIILKDGVGGGEPGNRGVIDLQGAVILNNPEISTSAVHIGMSGVSSNGNIVRISSLGRYKLNQEPVGLHYEVLDLRPKTWTDLSEHVRNPDEARRYSGFVAEEVLAVSEANDNSLDSLLTYDNAYELQGVQYDRVPAFLIPVIRDMAARIKQLEEAQA